MSHTLLIECKLVGFTEAKQKVPDDPAFPVWGHSQ